MATITLGHNRQDIKQTIDLASSKSESNRALVINALSGGSNELGNLANARDTETMIRLLNSPNEEIWDVLDAGTTMRFLTAFATVQGTTRVMTGSTRMKERPIALLVDALRSIGADISYEANDGYPPMRINGFDKEAKNNEITIRGDVSSQYISALLMIAPTLPNGLVLNLTGKIGSRPYILMTLNLMKHFGASHIWEGNTITVPAQQYQENAYTIEADWSAASYWYSIVALSNDGNAEIELVGLRKVSNQGDSVLVELMDQLGVSSTFTETGVILKKKEAQKSITWDFSDCPDIAQTISVVCAAKGISAELSGLESLRIKETDRIDAIKNELAKFGVVVEVEGDEKISIQNPDLQFPSEVMINTYKDHRMAMAFAPLAFYGELQIEDDQVVNKSYPDFWRDLSTVGFETK
ncbi:MAG: 3-phosphoshikimate 1-carboxyvinyltransferase [Cytophagales bacterium]|nr:3-phosphoshikimate 1-carboxyvinyltransferase [Cytophagales bacterium]